MYGPAFIFFLFFFGIWSSSALNASTDASFGLAGKASSAIGADSHRESTLNALTNPALLPMADRSQFFFGTQFVGSNRSALENVTVDSEVYKTREGRNRVDTFSFESHQDSLWSLGLLVPFSLPQWAHPKKMGIGIVASGPYGNLRQFNAGSSYDFTPLRYGTSDSQFKATLGSGIELVPQKLTFGIGVTMSISAAADASALVLSEDPTARMNLNVGIHSSLVSSLSYLVDTSDSKHTISLIYRQKSAPQLTERMQGEIDLGVGRGRAQIPFDVSTVIYYEPETWAASWRGDYLNFAFNFSLYYQKWSGYQAPSLLVRSERGDGTISRSQKLEANFVDTFSPAISVELPLNSKLVLTTGYQYRPSPVPDQTGQSNFLDNDAHCVGAGITWKTGESYWLPLPLEVSLGGQYHYLQNRTVVKENSGSIGAPGYSYSGNAYSIGLSFGATL